MFFSWLFRIKVDLLKIHFLFKEYYYYQNANASKYQHAFSAYERAFIPISILCKDFKTYDNCNFVTFGMV